jgi:all-trans-8'-apo-beta-carotenal 15,15'-oxygenase
MDLAPGMDGLLDLEPPEVVGQPLTIEGELPPFVRGTYYLNGPGRFRRGGFRYRHWLDGDGRVTALELGDGGARLSSRFVQSTKFVAEEAAGRPLFRTFGTGFPGDQLVRGVGLASPVNVSVYRAAGRLLAFGEQGLPWALDPRTLDTLGEHDFGRLSPVTPFSAHPHIDPRSGEMFNFGISYAARRPVLHFFHFAAAGGLLNRSRVPLAAPFSLHDFSLSGRYAAFLLAPYLLDVEALLAGAATVQEALAWRPVDPTELLVLERDTGQPVASVPVGPGYSLHQVNAFDDGDHLVVDLLALPEPVYTQYHPLPDLFATAPPARPRRLRVDPRRGVLVERHEVPFPWCADFPSIDPRKAQQSYRWFWMLAVSATGRPGRKFFDRLVGWDWEGPAGPGPAAVYAVPPGTYLGGEPVFVGDPEREDRGVVICQEIDALRRRGAFVVLDAWELAAGPLARIPLADPLPPGFHASFDPRPAGP